MDKRTFLKSSTLLAIGGTISIPAAIRAAGGSAKTLTPGPEKIYELPKLDYAYDALEPHIDAMTMELHHSKHHAGYTRKFNAALKETGKADIPLKKIMAEISQYPASVRNNGGGFINHKWFWNNLSPSGGGTPKGALLKAIEKNFGSFEKFRGQFSTAAATRFGSGWAWLVKTDKGLAVTSTANQDNPLMNVADVQGTPLLALDVWEHAYYLNYQNRRGDYVNAFWNVVNWDFVEEKFERLTRTK